MSKQLPSYERIQQLHERVYIPAQGDMTLQFKRLKSDILLALQEIPNDVCGVAQRVGWVHEAEPEQAIYRLKLHVRSTGFSNATIPGFFVLKDNVFVKFEPK